MTHTIEAILFDMGGTLRVTKKRSRQERLHYTGEMIKLLGSDLDPDKFSRLLARRSTAYRRWARQTLVELNESDLLTYWLLPEWPESFIREHAQQLHRLWRQATGERTIFPETAGVVLELFRRGYRLGLVSNTTSSSEAPEALEDLGLTSYFETLVLSAVVGIRKPDPAILLEATGRMGIQPEKCAYIGDLPHRDVAAARQAGFGQAILVRKRSLHRARRIEDHSLLPDQDLRSLVELLDLFPPRPLPQPGPVFTACASTRWAMKAFHNLGDFLEASRRIGFRSIELNHQIDTAMLAGIDFSQHRFRSVHEPCPADISVAELKNRNWLISTPDEACRREGVNSIKRSIDLARRLNATTVVIHSGTVDPDRQLEDRLRSLYAASQRLTPEYQETFDLLIARRRACAAEGFQALKQSLVELLEYARPFDIQLGLENRYHYLEFPSPNELEELLNLAGPDRLGFIFDVGHAQALSKLGFYPYLQWLERFGPRIIGVHLHDVNGLQDHHLPGQGEVDFSEIAAFIPEAAFRTLEFQGQYPQELVQASLGFLGQHSCIRKEEI